MSIRSVRKCDLVERNLSNYAIFKSYISQTFLRIQFRFSKRFINFQATGKETIKEDMEEADTKVEQSRDALATEMFNILSRENEFAEYILQFLKLQRIYHENALKNLQTLIPQLEKKIGMYFQNVIE